MGNKFKAKENVGGEGKILALQERGVLPRQLLTLKPYFVRPGKPVAR